MLNLERIIKNIFFLTKSSYWFIVNKKIKWLSHSQGVRVLFPPRFKNVQLATAIVFILTVIFSRTEPEVGQEINMDPKKVFIQDLQTTLDEGERFCLQKYRRMLPIREKRYL